MTNNQSPNVPFALISVFVIALLMALAVPLAIFNNPAASIHQPSIQQPPRASQSDFAGYFAVIADSDQLQSIPFISTNQSAATAYAEQYRQHHNYRVVKVLIQR